MDSTKELSISPHESVFVIGVMRSMNTTMLNLRRRYRLDRDGILYVTDLVRGSREPNAKKQIHDHRDESLDNPTISCNLKNAGF